MKRLILVIICALLLLIGCEATNSDTVTDQKPFLSMDNPAWDKFKMEALEGGDE